jgi:hypothetical protein
VPRDVGYVYPVQSNRSSLATIPSIRTKYVCFQEASKTAPANQASNWDAMKHSEGVGIGRRCQPSFAKRNSSSPVAVGMAIADRSRTDPYERHYRIRLLPWMMASKRNFTSRTPRNPWDTDFPALCRARVEFRNVLLGPRSSLHHLRRGSQHLLVRQLHRYYRRCPTPQRRACPACGKSPSRTRSPI